ncbi:MAG: 2-phospho-L-lactate guanylyltransferase [Steroidobacteraceae bacterium]
MWALVPVKRLAASKSRLASVLSPGQRVELMCRMLEDVLHALRCALSVKKIVVLSNERCIEGVLAGVERRAEAEEGDVNRSLAAAVANMPFTAQRVLILPADVPDVRADDIDALAAAHQGGLLVCPAIVDGGTNALLSSLPLEIPLHFGERSFARHLRAARQRGVVVQTMLRPALARDIDRPTDLDWLADPPHVGRAATYVRSLRGELSEREAG